MSEPRIIKKYPNRRLYDTALSRYITLEDVRRLVLDHTEFRVVDSRSDEDITRSILLQIIMEQEEDGQPMFTTEVLEQVIRFYGDALQGMLTRYFERSLQLFVEQQHRMREQMQNVMVSDPFAFVREMTERNLAVWKEMQESFLRGGGAGRGSEQGGEKTGRGRSGQSTEQGSGKGSGQREKTPDKSQRRPKKGGRYGQGEA